MGNPFLNPGRASPQAEPNSPNTHRLEKAAHQRRGINVDPAVRAEKGSSGLPALSH